MKPICPVCGGQAEWYKANATVKRIYCPKCSKYFKHTAAPKVLLFDIETSHIKADVYQIGKQVIRHDQITDDFFILSWAGKWLYQDGDFGATVTPKEAKARDDRRVVERLHNVIKRADFVITYNGNKFDIKKINWRFLIHRLNPVKQYQSIDLYAKMKQEFAPASLSLDFVLKELGYNGKHHTDAEMWRQVEAGNPKEIKRAYEYNKNDVWMMEDLYPLVRPYFKVHPNFASFLDMYQVKDADLELKEDEHRCPRCLMGIIHKSKFTIKLQTPTGYFYNAATCPNCGALIKYTYRDHGKQYVRVRS